MRWTLTWQLLSGQHGLHDFLSPRPGLNSGLKIPQDTAAALVNCNKVLATPASIDKLFTYQLLEDHASMSGTSALKLREIIANIEKI